MGYKVLKTKICGVCGCEYETTAPNTCYCPSCRKRVVKQQNKQSAKKRKRRLKMQSEIAAKSISEVVLEMMAYNEQHGTNLTYGRYVAMKEQNV